MARPKKTVESEEVGELPVPVSPRNLFSKLPLDYPNEGLNDLARKVNEIIDYLNNN